MAKVVNFPSLNDGIGVKYESVKNLNIAEIAKLVRADIKAAIQVGQIPQGKYSVKISRYAGGQSMSVRISDFNVEFLNVNRIFNLMNGVDFYNAGPRYTADGQDILDKVNDIVNAYNYDKSDSQIDYFNVSFYSHVNFDSDFEQKAKIKIEQELRSQAAI